jgi:hypothetical protein
MFEASVSDLQVADGRCFLCGNDGGGITQEHVFPKWLQNRYNLWDQRIGLLNDSNIPYRELKIPSCVTCNNEDLSRLESTVFSAVASGYNACIALDERAWYLWAGKLFYGILRKEIGLLHNRASPEEGTVISAATLKSFSNLYLFLQGIRGCHLFASDSPYSVLVCNLHDLSPNPREYCFRDSLMYMTIAIRMGEVGVIVALEDAGLTTRTYGRYISKVNGRKLHPLQFDELYARVTYQASLIEGGVNYLTSQDVDGLQPARTDVLGGIYLRERSEEEFARILRVHMADWVKEDTVWFVPPSFVPTWMTDDNGELRLLPLSSWQQGSD